MDIRNSKQKEEKRREIKAQNPWRKYSTESYR